MQESKALGVPQRGTVYQPGVKPRGMVYNPSVLKERRIPQTVPRRAPRDRRACGRRRRLTVGWIAERLAMGTRGYLNHLLYRRSKLSGE